MHMISTLEAFLPSSNVFTDLEQGRWDYRELVQVRPSSGARVTPTHAQKLRRYPIPAAERRTSNSLYDELMLPFPLGDRMQSLAQAMTLADQDSREHSLFSAWGIVVDLNTTDEQPSTFAEFNGLIPTWSFRLARPKDPILKEAWAEQCEGIAAVRSSSEHANFMYAEEVEETCSLRMVWYAPVDDLSVGSVYFFWPFSDTLIRERER